MMPRRLIFRDHVTRRMMQRGVRVADIRRVLEQGEVIEYYQTTFPPESLSLGVGERKAIACGSSGSSNVTRDIYNHRV